MTDYIANYSAEIVSASANMSDSRLDLAAITRQVRLCRSTLGAILDELECGDRGHGTLEKLAECAMSVTGEIEDLWESIKQSR